jgi:hypothetical protein
VDVSLTLSITGLAISLITVGISTVLVARQIRFQRHANQVPVVISLGQEYRSDDFQRAQDYVVNTLRSEHDPSSGISGLPDQARHDVRQVSTFFTNLGTLVFLGMIDEEFAIGFLGYRARNDWEALEPYIVQERQLTNNPDLLVFFEDLVCRVRENGPVIDAYPSRLKRVTPPGLSVASVNEEQKPLPA